jgi:prepilin-type N-terminal cleavage/methylation domain-containing protein
MKITHQKAQGFTLVELLVVIAIIATLAALSTPVIMKALVKAKVVSAKAVCVSLGNAVDRFESEYSYLPTNTIAESASEAEDERSSGDIMAALAGEEADSALNIKDIKFFTLGSAKNKADGMDIVGNLVTTYDPWGNEYYIKLDIDLNGEIATPDKNVVDVEKKKIRGKLALVYSSGPESIKPDEAESAEWRLMPTNFK